MRRFLYAIGALLMFSSLAACSNASSGNLGLGSILGPQVGAEQTEYDQNRIGKQSQRLREQTTRLDDFNSANTIDPGVLLTLVNYRKEAKAALQEWDIDPRSEALAQKAISLITRFEKKLDELGAPAAKQVSSTETMLGDGGSASLTASVKYDLTPYFEHGAPYAVMQNVRGGHGGGHGGSDGGDSGGEGSNGGGSEGGGSEGSGGSEGGGGAESGGGEGGGSEGSVDCNGTDHPQPACVE
jgi:hypothetical protein